MLRVAICGAGNWGTRLIESVQGRSAKIRFAAAVTRDPAARKPLGERFGLALSARYADVLEDPAIDAVVLAYLYRGVLLSQVGDRDRAQADLLTLRNLDAGLADGAFKSASSDVPASQTRQLRLSSTVQSISLAAAERRHSARRQR